MLLIWSLINSIEKFSWGKIAIKNVINPIFFVSSNPNYLLHMQLTDVDVLKEKKKTIYSTCCEYNSIQ